MNFLTKGILTVALLTTSSMSMLHLDVTADTQKVNSEYQIKQPASDLDVSQGWDILNYESDTLPNVDDVFLQGIEPPGNQKCVLVQAGNVGDASLTAQKVIPMKKGHQYDIDLIYAQFYDKTGSGYIDFNGDKIVSNNDTNDKEYKKTITPKVDMNYTITVFFTTAYPGNAYFKLGYDKSGDGISDKVIDFGAPVVSPAPEVGDNKIMGTANVGNTVEVTDNQGKNLGTSKVLNNGSFELETNRLLHYNEKLHVVQKNDLRTSPEAVVEVTDTKAPDAPVLNKITDNDRNVTGKAEPNSTVNVSFEGKSGKDSYQGTAQSDGTFTIPLDQTYHGQTKLIAYAEDEAKNKSPEIVAKVEFADKLIVALTHHVSSMDNSVFGTTSRPNCQITIHFGSRVYRGNSDENGKFNISIDKYAPGTNLTIEAQDPYDSKNPVSIDDKVLPRIPGLITRTSGVKILSGVADPNAQISLTLSRGEKKYSFTATADNNGNFSITLKDDKQDDLSLSIGDKLTYSATLTDVNLTSEVGTSTIYAFY